MSVLRSPVHVGGVKFRATKMGTTEVGATITLPAGFLLTTANTLRFLQVGANTKVVSLNLSMPELDTGTNTLTLNVGFLSHNTGAQNSNATAYATAATVGQAGGEVRYEPVIAAPLANYTIQIVPAANANANAVGGGAKRISLLATLAPADFERGLIADPVDGSGGFYDHGRANPVV